MMNKEAILYVTHYFDDFIIHNITKLKNELDPKKYDIYCLFNLLNKNYPSIEHIHALNGVNIFYYTDNDIIESLTRTYGNIVFNEWFRGPSITYNNAMMPVMYFYYTHHNTYQRYWYFENDCYFNGRYGDFFDLLYDTNIDYIYPYNIEGQDDFKQTINIANLDLIRSYNALFGLTQNALGVLNEHYKQGVHGHYEWVLPTLLCNNNLISTLTLKEINALNESTFAVSDTKRCVHELNIKNIFYHPVKKL